MSKVAIPGSNPTFIIDSKFVVKIFTPFLDGYQAFKGEMLSYEILQSSNIDETTVMPRILYSSTLSNVGSLVVDDKDIPSSTSSKTSMPLLYIVMTYLDGIPVANAWNDIPQDDRADLAQKLGCFLKNYHKVTKNHPLLSQHPSNFFEFIDNQRKTCVERHRKWGTLSETVLNELDHYLPSDMKKFMYNITSGEMEKSFCLIHGDITSDHVLMKKNEINNRWSLSGILDWADSSVGILFYEIPALIMSCLHCDNNLFNEFIKCYNIVDTFPSITFVNNNDDDILNYNNNDNMSLSYICMVFVLLFQFDSFSEAIYSIHPEYKTLSLKQLECALFSTTITTSLAY
eukprot:TRINITY_DN6363_c0_g1_i1.p1 TRINITY_DN6363_c0_g1~~TRINITY_DN6363_c0_g1_i1.p1  ORF type:complete len:383 (+),score=57.74 TRINITY_DN6363_c0_g1_i1:120-1151(+)